MIVTILKNNEPIFTEYHNDLNSATYRAALLERAIIANGFRNFVVKINKIN